MKIKEGFSGERSIILPKAILGTVEADPLASLLYITDIGYYPHAEHHYRCRTEPIEQYVFSYCIDGKGWYEVEGKRREVNANQYFILPAGVPHVYGADSGNPWTIYWIHFRGPLAPHYAAGCIDPQDVAPSADSRISTRIAMFEEIYGSLAASFTVESIRYAMASFQHYLASLRYLQQYRTAAGGRRTPDGGIIEAAIHFFNENIERHLTLAEVADYVGFSSSHLSAVFRQRTGHSPLNYFNILKIRRACEMLDSTDMKLNQISFKLGIDDPYYFSRLFSKLMGVSPKAYRSHPKA